MSYGIISIGKHHRYGGYCPICGKPDYCGVDPETYPGHDIILCKRDTDSSNTIGRDGNFYIFTGLSRSGVSKYEEVTSYSIRTGVTTSKSSFKDFKEQQARKIERAERIKPLPDSKLDKIYRFMLDHLILEDRHRDYLLKEGWTEEMIKKYNIKSLPVDDYMRYKDNIKTKNPKRSELGRILYEKFGDLTGVPGSYIKEGQKGRYWTFAGYDGIIFPITNAYKQIYRLRIRLENPPPKKGKYRNLASFKEVEENGILVNKYENGTESGNAIGIYQENCYGPADYYCCYLVEGEKKAMMTNYKLGAPAISIPGVDSWRKILDTYEETMERLIDALKNKGVKVIIICYDNDKYRNAAVMKNQNFTVQALKKEDLMIGLGEWDSWKGRGIDDVLSKGENIMYFLA